MPTPQFPPFPTLASPGSAVTPVSMLDLVGGTPVVPLRAVVSAGHARVLVKIESTNPTGSLKDRMALAMIEAARRDGRLLPGGAVVEYTGGSTGVSLAFVCAALGHPLHIVSSDAFAREKLDHMRLLGARLEVVPSDGGRMTAALTHAMVDAARAIATRTGAFWTDQLRNADQTRGYRRLADELLAQTGGRLDAFVQSVGTAGSLRGVAEGLRASGSPARIIAVEPAESAVLSGGPSGAHRIDGVGAGFIVPLWDASLVHGIERVSTDEARAMAFRLACEEAIFAGTSTGANVVAALRIASTLGPGAVVATVMCDTGMKYLQNYGATLDREA
ncbi:MAG: PLP-dependent cysteine synthase family protein [Vicinamibacterales bacterium]